MKGTALAVPKKGGIMEGSPIAEAIASVGRAFASPAKIAFIGYVVLAYTGKIEVNLCQFLIIASIFFFLQIFHDDFLREALNLWGKRLGNWGASDERTKKQDVSKMQPSNE
ncbi:MAG: hypothetical protein WB424_01700 [Terracidiphilus sp.]